MTVASKEKVFEKKIEKAPIKEENIQKTIE